MVTKQKLHDVISSFNLELKCRFDFFDTLLVLRLCNKRNEIKFF